MGDERRFQRFGELIKSKFPPAQYQHIADIAGGKGQMQQALIHSGYSIITYDKRKGRKDRLGRFNYRYQYFSSEIKDRFDLLIGMHPDEATDVIIVEAIKRNIPFAIVPCCVKPSAVVYWGQHCTKDWLIHLKSIAISGGYIIEETMLKINGKNTVLIGYPHDA